MNAVVLAGVFAGAALAILSCGGRDETPLGCFFAGLALVVVLDLLWELL